MRVQVVEDVGEFAARARPWLERFPVEANLAATVTEWAAIGRYRADDGLWLLVLDRRGEVIGAVLQTPPYELILPPLPDGAPTAVAATLAGRGWHLPGVTGPTEAATAFAEAWARLTGVTVRRALSERMYDLEAVVLPRGVSGSARPAAEPDTALCLRWWDEFTAEALPGSPRPDPTELVVGRIGDGLLWLWEDDGEPVSLAGVHAPAAGVARVGPVYTPPARRRRGYGSGVTAAASQAALDAGAHRCMLYTDLANPTSNAIYQRLGYREVGDGAVYRFEQPA